LWGGRCFRGVAFASAFIRNVAKDSARSIRETLGEQHDRERGETSEPEAGVDDLEWRPHQHHGDDNGEDVERRRPMIDGAREQVDDGSERRTSDGGTGADDEGVETDDGEREPGAGAWGQADESQQAEDQGGEDRDVAAGNRNDVECAGALQPLFNLLIEAGAVADENGCDDGG
jgi:hypothetical protein